MAGKPVIYREEVRDRICRGIDALVDAVKVPPWQPGHTIIIECEFGSPKTLNSGAVVTRHDLQNAGSIAGLILTTACMITTAPKLTDTGETSASRAGVDF